MLAAYAGNYRDLWENHWWWQVRRRFVLRLLDSLAARRPLKRILDVGCGDGLFFEHLSRYGDPRGVESDAGLVDPKGPWAPRVTIAPFGAAYPDAGGYDAVLMLDSLEHIEDDRGAARRAFELLAPGGFLLLTVPALQSLWSVHDVANRHFRRYEKEGLREVLRSAGFEVESLSFYFAWPVLPMYARKLLGGGGAGAGDYSVRPPSRPLNGLLYALSALEQSLTGPRGTPVGSSLFAVARRPLS